MSEVDDTITRIKTHKSVQGIVIVNNEGKLVKSTYSADKKDEESAIIKSIPQLCQKARSTVRDLNPTNELVFLRIKSKMNEILVAPDKDFILIVVQVQGKGDKKEE